MQVWWAIMKQWCFEHGEKALDGSQSSGAVRYIDNNATGFAMEISVKDGKLFLVQWNIGGEAHVRELPDNMAVFVKLRERTEFER